MNNHLWVRQPSSGNPSNSPFLAATIQLPQLRERNRCGPAVPGRTICCRAAADLAGRARLSIRGDVPVRQMCHSALLLRESAQVMADVSLLLFTDSHCSAGVPGSAPLLTAPLAALSSGTKTSQTSTADTSLNNHSFPLHLQGCRLQHCSPTLYLTYFLTYK